MKRSLPVRWPALIEVIPRESGNKRLLIQMFFETDATFHAWFSSLPYLDKYDAGEREYRVRTFLQ
jgi:hypothetical protein